MTDTKEDELVGSTLDGRYRLLRQLGAGGMGTVYLAEQLGFQRQVVVKTLRRDMFPTQSACKRFEREALLVARLKHPNIVSDYDFGQTLDGTLYLVMEYLEGQTLQQYMDKRAGRLDSTSALQFTDQVLSALAEAHEKGLVHRGLKPENIMITRKAGISEGSPYRLWAAAGHIMPVDLLPIPPVSGYLVARCHGLPS